MGRDRELQEGGSLEGSSVVQDGGVRELACYICLHGKLEKSLEEFGIGPDRAFESAGEQGTCDDTQPCVLAVVHIHRTTL